MGNVCDAFGDDTLEIPLEYDDELSTVFIQKDSTVLDLKRIFLIELDLPLDQQTIKFENEIIPDDTILMAIPYNNDNPIQLIDLRLSSILESKKEVNEKKMNEQEELEKKREIARNREIILDSEEEEVMELLEGTSSGIRSNSYKMERHSSIVAELVYIVNKEEMKQLLKINHLGTDEIVNEAGSREAIDEVKVELSNPNKSNENLVVSEEAKVVNNQTNPETASEVNEADYLKVSNAEADKNPIPQCDIENGKVKSENKEMTKSKKVPIENLHKTDKDPKNKKQKLPLKNSSELSNSEEKVKIKSEPELGKKNESKKNSTTEKESKPKNTSKAKKGEK